MNYFELFEMPVEWRPDKNALRKKFLELSGKYHPDRFAGGSDEEQEKSLEMTSQLNKAYKTLSDPDELIRYVLEQKGLLVTDEKYNLPPGFLMEMMELNDELGEAGDDENKKAELIVKLRTAQQEIYEPVHPVIENFRDGITGEAELLQLKDYYFKKKYLLRVAQQLGQKL
jgi:molecular chaperone HscB